MKPLFIIIQIVLLIHGIESTLAQIEACNYVKSNQLIDKCQSIQGITSRIACATLCNIGGKGNKCQNCEGFQIDESNQTCSIGKKRWQIQNNTSSFIKGIIKITYFDPVNSSLCNYWSIFVYSCQDQTIDHWRK